MKKVSHPNENCLKWQKGVEEYLRIWVYHLAHAPFADIKRETAVCQNDLDFNGWSNFSIFSPTRFFKNERMKLKIKATDKYGRRPWVCPKLLASVINRLLNISVLCLYCVYHQFNSLLKYFYWDVGHGSGLIGMENVCFGWLGCAVGRGEGQLTFGRTWDDYNAKHSSITLSLFFFNLTSIPQALWSILTALFTSFPL